MNMTRNFSWSETTDSGLALRLRILVQHTEATKAAALALAINLLQPLRERLGPLIVTSWLRPVPLQAALLGYAPDTIARLQASPDAGDQLLAAEVLRKAAQSQHTKGEAVDVFSHELRREAIVRELFRRKLVWDQCIVYDNQPGKERIVHLSYTATGENRRQLLVSRAPGRYARVEPSAILER